LELTAPSKQVAAGSGGVGTSIGPGQQVSAVASLSQHPMTLVENFTEHSLVRDATSHSLQVSEVDLDENRPVLVDPAQEYSVKTSPVAGDGSNVNAHDWVVETRPLNRSNSAPEIQSIQLNAEYFPEWFLDSESE
jgi:hypothetical protein